MAIPPISPSSTNAVTTITTQQQSLSHHVPPGITTTSSSPLPADVLERTRNQALAKLNPTNFIVFPQISEELKSLNQPFFAWKENSPQQLSFYSPYGDEHVATINSNSRITFQGQEFNSLEDWIQFISQTAFVITSPLNLETMQKAIEEKTISQPFLILEYFKDSPLKPALIEYAKEFIPSDSTVYPETPSNPMHETHPERFINSYDWSISSEALDKLLIEKKVDESMLDSFTLKKDLIPDLTVLIHTLERHTSENTTRSIVNNNLQALLSEDFTLEELTSVVKYLDKDSLPNFHLRIDDQRKADFMLATFPPECFQPIDRLAHGQKEAASEVPDYELYKLVAYRPHLFQSLIEDGTLDPNEIPSSVMNSVPTMSLAIYLLKKCPHLLESQYSYWQLEVDVNYEEASFLTSLFIEGKLKISNPTELQDSLLHLALRENRYESRLNPFLKESMLENRSPFFLERVPASDMIEILRDEDLTHVLKAFKNCYAMGIPHLREIFTPLLASQSIHPEDCRFLFDNLDDEDTKYFIDTLQLTPSLFRPSSHYTITQDPTTPCNLENVEDCWPFLLNSNVNDVINWVQSHPDPDKKASLLQYIEQQRTGPLCLIARFPPHIQAALETEYSYEENQKNYSDKRLQVSQALNPQEGFFTSYQRLFVGRDGPFKTLRFSDSMTPIAGRYERFRSLVHQTRLSRHPLILVSENGYQVSHTLRTGETVQLTSINARTGGEEGKEYDLVWDHTETTQFPPILKELSELYAKLKVGDSSDIDRDIAYFYWLGCHACPTNRGNSQHMLELRKFLLECNGRKATPLDRECCLPDCVALCTPFDVFYSEWYAKAFEARNS